MSASEVVEQVAGAAPFARCRAGRSIETACDGLADDLLDLGIALPSVYLLIGERLRCLAARGYFQVVDGFLPTAGVIGGVVSSRQGVVLSDLTTHAEFIGAIPGIRAEICMPVLLGGRAVGAVNAESLTALDPAWPAQMQAAAAVLAERIGALGGMPAESVTQRMARAVVKMATATDVRDIENQAVRAAVDISGMRSAFVARRHPRLRVTTAVGPLARTALRFSADDLADMAGWVSAGTSTYFPGGTAVPDGYRFLSDAAVRSLSVYPLMATGEHTGVLAMIDDAPMVTSREVTEALELLATQAATSIATALAIEELGRRASHDALTGCHNFGTFAADLMAATRLRRQDEMLACMIVDVDHFKAVNDDHGHEAGDALLCALAAALRTVLRQGDRLYRLGGDEFAILAYVTHEDGAAWLAGRAVAIARRTGASVSIGVACADGDGVPSLRARADAALYDAKRSGRDAAHLAPWTPSEPATGSFRVVRVPVG